MSDKERLENIAKVAGVKGRWREIHCMQPAGFYTEEHFLWNPQTNIEDCFRMQEAIIKKFRRFIVTFDGYEWVITASFQGITAKGKTLQDAWCNLAVAIGKAKEQPHDN